jgi:hypothetical protein
MERIVRVHYGGDVVEGLSGGAKFSSTMAVKVAAFRKCPQLFELQARVKEVLQWHEVGVRVKLQGRYDIGHGHSHKMMMQLDSEEEWDAYVLVMKESEWKCLEVVARKELSVHGTLDLNQCPPDDACDAIADNEEHDSTPE